MQIYIQSRGIAQENDYKWLKLPDQTPEIPQELHHISVENIDSQKYSLILAKRNNQFILLVTGMQSRVERTDFMGRRIRNSVLWIGEDERKIRSLVIQALQNREKLTQDVDQTIETSGEFGFSVQDKLINLDYLDLIQLNEDNITSRKLGQNIEKLKQEIALELETNCLSNKSGLLILVTTLKNEESMKKTGVWRGLSDKIQYDYLQEYTAENLQLAKMTKKKTAIGVILMILLILVVILMLKAL